MKLSVIIPAYNEEKTIVSILERIRCVRLNGGFDKEIIVINDYSTDNTESLILKYQSEHPDLNITYYRHDKNQGKGAAIHSGIQKSTGDYIIVQDADLEYDPQEYNLLLQPVLDGYADIVYGSRFTGGKPHRILFFWHSIGNK
ncbi:MAG TPA: glycosyltransferase family 2 protein, partial [Saprospiraceae bacterium]|nr:glycosyltransferase family 2 protein [Saprospiraceae bacterium]